MKKSIKEWIASLIIIAITITVMFVFGYANSQEEVKQV